MFLLSFYITLLLIILPQYDYLMSSFASIESVCSLSATESIYRQAHTTAGRELASALENYGFCRTTVACSRCNFIFADLSVATTWEPSNEHLSNIHHYKFVEGRIRHRNSCEELHFVTPNSGCLVTSSTTARKLASELQGTRWKSNRDLCRNLRSTSAESTAVRDPGHRVFLMRLRILRGVLLVSRRRDTEGLLVIFKRRWGIDTTESEGSSYWRWTYGHDRHGIEAECGKGTLLTHPPEDSLALSVRRGTEQ